jgi:lipid-binding SYLF domain-containing protein
MITKQLRISVSLTAVLLFLATYSAYNTSGWASVQKADPGKFRHAVLRSEDAGRIITMIAVLPDMTIPKELMERAEAIGVFPKVVRETALFLYELKGYGVISARQGSSWTLPAFYRFGGGGYGSPFAGTDAHAVILLFMKKDAVSWFEKGGLELKNEKKAIEGPIGQISDVQRKQLEDVQVIAYAYYNGRLDGKAFGSSFWKAFGLNPDNNINNPVYGVKGREVLTGKPIDPAKVLPGIASFQDALVKYYARS